MKMFNHRSINYSAKKFVFLCTIITMFIVLLNIFYNDLRYNKYTTQYIYHKYQEDFDTAVEYLISDNELIAQLKSEDFGHNAIGFFKWIQLEDVIEFVKEPDVKNIFYRLMDEEEGVDISVFYCEDPLYIIFHIDTYDTGFVDSAREPVYNKQYLTYYVNPKTANVDTVHLFDNWYYQERLISYTMT